TWLVNQLDQPIGVPSPAPNGYALSGDDVTQVFNLSNPRVPMETQEMVTLIRSVADIQRIFIYNARKTIVVRTSPDYMALTAWLVKQLDRQSAPCGRDRKSTRLNSSHGSISYAVFCLKIKNEQN